MQIVTKTVIQKDNGDVIDIEQHVLEFVQKVVKEHNNTCYVNAIKFIRTHTNLGLKDAKDFVDMLRDTDPVVRWQRSVK